MGTSNSDPLLFVFLFACKYVIFPLFSNAAILRFMVNYFFPISQESVAHTIPDGEEKALIRRIDDTVLQNITRRSDLPTNAERVMQAICGTREKVSAFT